MSRVDLLPHRLASKVSVDGQTDCWEWTGAKTRGYGVTRWNGRTVLVHRLARHLLIGDVPVFTGMNHEAGTLDHLCNNRGCANPAHTQTASNRANVARGTNDRTNKSSRFVGVSWRRDRKRWEARFKSGGRNHHLGYYATEAAAASAYLEAIRAVDAGTYAVALGIFEQEAER